MSRSTSHGRQQELFACQSPAWRRMPNDQQIQIVDLLTQLFVDHASRAKDATAFLQPRSENENHAREDYA